MSPGRRPVVLALGGGGMRGVAHLGVLAELDGAAVEVRGIAGTSSGALMGALWLIEGSAGAIERVRSFVASGRARPLPDFGEPSNSGGWESPIRRIHHGWHMLRALLTRHAVSLPELFAEVSFFLPDLTIESLAVPFLAVATDNATGEEVRLARGPIRAAVAASSAMPGLAPPVPVDGHRLQDGGAVAEIPVGAARTLGQPVIAVEVSEALPVGDPDHDRLPRAMFRAAAMGWQELRRRMLADADAVIAPAINHVHWADYGAVDEAIEAGRAAARAFLADRA